jgi:Family of unknown function (DUF5985)
VAVAEAIYILCALTSLGCAILLLRSFKQTGARLLLWTGVCFIGLFLNNVLLFVDLVVTGPSIDLSVPRALVALATLLLFIYGLIFEASGQ